MLGSAEAVREVVRDDRLRRRREVLVVSGDAMFGARALVGLAEAHRARRCDMTVLCYEREPAGVVGGGTTSEVAAPPKKKKVDPAEVEIFLLSGAEDRIAMKMPLLELEDDDAEDKSGSLRIDKSLLRRAPRLRARSDLVDGHAYFFDGAALRHGFFSDEAPLSTCSSLAEDVITAVATRHFKYAHLPATRVPEDDADPYAKYTALMKQGDYEPPNSLNRLSTATNPDSTSFSRDNSSHALAVHVTRPETPPIHAILPPSSPHGDTPSMMMAAAHAARPYFIGGATAFVIKGQDHLFFAGGAPTVLDAAAPSPFSNNNNNDSSPGALKRGGGGADDDGDDALGATFALRIRAIQPYAAVCRHVVARAVNSLGPLDAVDGKVSQRDGSLVGCYTVVGDKVQLKHTTVGARCHLGARCKINNSVIFDGARIGDGSVIQNSIICAGAVIGDKSNLNDVQVGANAHVAPNTVAKQEVFVENHGAESDE